MHTTNYTDFRKTKGLKMQGKVWLDSWKKQYFEVSLSINFKYLNTFRYQHQGNVLLQQAFLKWNGPKLRAI